MRALVMVFALAGAAAAQEPRAGEIRVCLEEFRNLSKRPVALPVQRNYLKKRLEEAKPPKRAADRRPLDAVLLEGRGVERERLEAECDFRVALAFVDVREAGDPQTLRERMDDPFRGQPAAKLGDELSYARLEFQLFKSGDPRAWLELSVERTERMSVDATVMQALDRVAQRVNSAVREPAEDFRE